MSNFAGDFSSAYSAPVTLWASSTGVSTSANAQGVSVDISYDVSNVISAFLICGNVAGTNPTMDLKMQNSTDGTNSWTDITDGAFTQVTTSSAAQCIPLKPTKQYVRVTGTVSGTNPVFEATVMLLFPNRTSPSSVGGFSNTVAAV